MTGGLTACNRRSNRLSRVLCFTARGSHRESLFPSFFLPTTRTPSSLFLSPPRTPNREHLLPWRFEDSTKEKVAPLVKSSLLPRLNRFPKRLDRLNRVSSLQGTSNLDFARSINFMDRFENALVEHLLGTPRDYPLSLVRFGWINLEDSNFGFELLQAVRPPVTGGSTACAVHPRTSFPLNLHNHFILMYVSSVSMINPCTHTSPGWKGAFGSALGAGGLTACHRRLNRLSPGQIHLLCVHAIFISFHPILILGVLYILITSS